MRRPLAPGRFRSLPLYTVSWQRGSTLGRNRHRYASLFSRLPWPKCSGKPSLGCRYGRVWIARHGGMFRCPEGFLDRQFVRKSCREIDRNRKISEYGNCLHTAGRNCRIRVLARSPSTARKRSVPYTSATLFLVTVEEKRPKFTADLKSIQVIKRINLLIILLISRNSKS